MKKRRIGLISALLAVLLLAGCGSVEQAAESIAEAVSGSSFSGARPAITPIPRHAKRPTRRSSSPDL